MGADSDRISTLGQLIPEFHFDLVARILPGAFTILSVFGLAAWPFDAAHSRSPVNWASSVIASLLFLGASYLTGLLLGEPGRYLGRIYDFKVWAKVISEYDDVIRNVIAELPVRCAGKTPGALTQDDRRRLFRILADHLEQRSELVRSMLTKMSAESRCCENLAAGSAFAALATFPIGLLRGEPIGWCGGWSLVFLFIAFGSILQGERRLEQLIRRAMSYFALDSYAACRESTECPKDISQGLKPI
jgi:hypothetical protein